MNEGMRKQWENEGNEEGGTKGMVTEEGMREGENTKRAETEKEMKERRQEYEKSGNGEGNEGGRK